jgi:hypothetical protein
MVNGIKIIFLVNICLIMIITELFSQPNESKRAEKMLVLTIPKPFQAWMRVRQISQHSNLSWVVFTAWMRAGGARPISSCFHNWMRAKELKRCLSSQSQSLFRLG